MTAITHKKGTTFYGLEIELINSSGNEQTFIGSTISCEFRLNSKTGTLALTLDTDNGVSIVDATHAQIDEQIINIAAGLYYADIKIEFANGEVDASQEIKLTVTQNVTS